VLGVNIFKLINIVITAHKSRTHPPGDISYKARTIQGTEYPEKEYLEYLEKANLSYFTKRRKS
jgi:hypothetical protein